MKPIAADIIMSPWSVYSQTTKVATTFTLPKMHYNTET